MKRIHRMFQYVNDIICVVDIHYSVNEDKVCVVNDVGIRPVLYDYTIGENLITEQRPVTTREKIGFQEYIQELGLADINPT